MQFGISAVSHSRSPRRIALPAILAAILALAFGLRLHYALDCKAVPVESDMAYYNELALRSGIPAEVPPGYPLFLRLVYAIWGPRNYAAVYIVQAVLSGITVLLIYLVARSVAGERAGLFAAGIAAAYPSFIAYNLVTMTETVSLLLVLCLFAALTIPRSERTRSVLAAASIAAGYLFKPALLLFAPGTLLSVKRRRVFIVALAVLLGPLLAHDLISGTSALRGARGLYRSYNPAASTADSPMEGTELGRGDLPPRTYLGAALDFLRHNKMKTAEMVYTKASLALSRGIDDLVLRPVIGRRYGLSTLLIYAYVPVAFLGFIGMARYLDSRNRRVAFPALGYVLFVVLLSIFKIRYRLMAEPAMILFAAIALDRAAGIRVPRPSVSWISRLAAPPAADPAPASAQSAAAEPPSRWSRIVPESIRRDWDIAGVILLAALALRLYFAFATPAPIDAAEAADWSRFAEGTALGPNVAPLYPLFLRAVYAVFGAADFRTVFVLQALLSAAAVLMIYGAVSSVAGRRAAAAAGLIAALLPDLFIMPLELSPQTLVLFCAAALLSIAASSLSSAAKAALSGLFAGLGIMLAPWFAWLVPGTLVTQRRWRLFLLVLAAALIPYVVFGIAKRRSVEPIYQSAVYEIRVPGAGGDGGVRGAVERLYQNATIALSRRWGTARSTSQNAETRISTFAAGWIFVTVLWLGLAGIARCWRNRHWRVFLPPLLYMLLIVVLSKFHIWERAVFLPALVAYAGMLVTGSCKERNG